MGCGKSRCIDLTLVQPTNCPDVGKLLLASSLLPLQKTLICHSVFFPQIYFIGVLLSGNKHTLAANQKTVFHFPGW